MKQGNVWAVVLAGGDGSRIGALTTDARGRVVPKQYCSVDGGQTLLSLAVNRARAIASPERVCVVVVANHWQWWQPMAADFDSGNLIVQSADRGIGVAVLLASLTIMKRDPEARIAFLPSDHHAQKDSVLTLAARDAVDSVGAKSPDLVVVGITPESPDTDVGYLVPSLEDSPDSHGLEGVTQAQDERHAKALIARGALWNSMIVAGRAAAFVAQFIPHHPGLVARMQVLVGRCDDPSSPPLALEDLFERLPSIDMIDEILQPAAKHLRVTQAPACGWNRVSTPRAVQTMVHAMKGNSASSKANSSEQLRRLPNLRAAVMGSQRRKPESESARA